VGIVVFDYEGNAQGEEIHRMKKTLDHSIRSIRRKKEFTMSTQIKTLIIVILLAALLALTGCAAINASGASGDNEVAAGIAQDGQQVELNQGQVLVVTLASNPTTGYSWAVAAVDPALLAQAGDPVYNAPDEQKTPLVGAGGSETLRFTASAAGTTTLRLEYRRPWEKDQPAAQTYTLQVVVR
jgi:inhibitor of cysteine peptidase